MLQEHAAGNLEAGREGVRQDGSDQPTVFSGPPPARVVVGPLRAVPAVQRRRDDTAGHLRPRPPAVTMDRIRGDVRLRIGPYRVRRMATAPRRRLTPFRAPGRSRPGKYC